MKWHFKADSYMNCWNRQFSNSTLFEYEYPITISCLFKNNLCVMYEYAIGSRAKMWEREI